jgi:RNA polymerase sigma-70 factor (ECF subfamily)
MKDTQTQFNTEYAAYSDAIFRYCFIQTRDRAVALDLTQDVFIKFWEYLAQGKDIEYTKAFLYRSAHNRVIDYRRKKKESSLDQLQEDDNFDPSDSEQTEKAINQHDGAKVRILLDELPEAYRAVLTMKYVDDLTLDEIVAITEETKNTVSVRIHRAEAKLQTIYKNKYGNE